MRCGVCDMDASASNHEAKHPHNRDDSQTHTPILNAGEQGADDPLVTRQQSASGGLEFDCLSQLEGDSMINIHTNTSSLSAQRHLTNNSLSMQRNIEKLSSGFRINRASDDAAGLAISEEMRADLRSLQQANRNASDAVSMIQTAETSMGEMTNILSRMRELAMQSASDGINDTQRGYVESEASELRAEIDRMVQVAEYNGVPLIDGTLSATFQVGLDSGDTIDLVIGTDLDTTGLGVDAVDLSTRAGADAALAAIDTALETVSGFRAELGAKENRISTIQTNLSVMYETLSASNARIREVDVANEMAGFTKNQILVQASTSMLAQANSYPEVALSLLG
jgi:flagellin